MENSMACMNYDSEEFEELNVKNEKSTLIFHPGSLGRMHKRIA